LLLASRLVKRRFTTLRLNLKNLFESQTSGLGFNVLPNWKKKRPPQGSELELEQIRTLNPATTETFKKKLKRSSACPPAELKPRRLL
jgi:hypothetical protein